MSTETHIAGECSYGVCASAKHLVEVFRMDLADVLKNTKFDLKAVASQQAALALYALGHQRGLDLGLQAGKSPNSKEITDAILENFTAATVGVVNGLIRQSVPRN